MPWKRGALALVVVLAPLSCGRIRADKPAGTTPDQRLRSALVALDSGQYAAATSELLALSDEYPDRVVGRQALLSAAAAKVDPRNPQRQLDEGAALLGRYLRRSTPGDWVQPQVESLYLLSLELGAAAERAEQAEAEAARARAEVADSRRGLPRLPGAPVTEKLDDLTRDRDRLAARVKDLESTTAGLQKEFADSVQELKRIRRTLRP